jgi:succinoglycan biosynthesis protein ExoA
MEVLVVDGMSDDGTREKLEAWCRRQPGVRVLDNPQRVVPTAMNIGIRAARGKWIIRADAHAEYPADYFVRCLLVSQRTEADNVGGGVITAAREDNAPAELVRALTTHPFGVGNAGFRTGAREGPADTVVFGCYRREVFDRIGLYDERLVRNQDYELNSRLRKAGGTIWYDPTICALYHNQATLKGLLRQALVTAQWNPWMWYVAPYSLAWRHVLPAVFVGVILGALVLCLIAPRWGLLALAVILLPYVSTAVAASLRQAHRHGQWMFALLPPLFAAYHVTYGAGILWGTCVLAARRAPVQRVSEPWPGAGTYRALPLKSGSER